MTPDMVDLMIAERSIERIKLRLRERTTAELLRALVFAMEARDDIQWRIKNERSQ